MKFYFSDLIIQRSFENWEKLVFVVQKHSLKGRVFHSTRRFCMQTGDLLETETIFLNGVRVAGKSSLKDSDQLDSSNTTCAKERTDLTGREDLTSEENRVRDLFGKRYSPLKPKSLFQKKPTPNFPNKSSMTPHNPCKLDPKNVKTFAQVLEGSSTDSKEFDSGKNSNYSSKFSKYSKKSSKSYRSSRLNFLKNKKVMVTTTKVYFPNQPYFLESCEKKLEPMKFRKVRGLLKSKDPLEMFLSLPVTLELSKQGVPFLQLGWGCPEKEVLDNTYDNIHSLISFETLQSPQNDLLCNALFEKSFLKDKLKKQTTEG